MSGTFLSPELKFFESTFTGDVINLREFLSQDEYAAVALFEGPHRRLKRNAADYLCKNQYIE